MEILITAILTALSFLFGQYILNFVVEPIKEFNKQKGDVSYLLLRYQAPITNARQPEFRDGENIEEMPAALVSTMSQIPFYKLLSKVSWFGLPLREDVFSAARELNGIIHRLKPSEKTKDAGAENSLAVIAIGKLLKIDTTYLDRFKSGKNRN